MYFWTAPLSSLLPLSPGPIDHSWKEGGHRQIQNQTSRVFAGDDANNYLYCIENLHYKS